MGERWKIALLLAPALTVIGVLFAGGLVAAVVQSLGYLPAIGSYEVGFEAYREVLGSDDFLDSLALTLYVAGASTLLSTVLAVLAALALRRSSGSLPAVVFQLPITIPHLLAAVGIALVVSQTGLGARLAALLGLIGEPKEFPALLYDRYSVGIILTYVWKEVPFIALVVLASLRGVAAELEDVARTLGAGAWQRFWYVVFPVISPGIVAASLIVFAFTFGAFEVPYLLGKTYPTTLPVTAYNEYRDIDLESRPTAMAINVLITLLTALFAAAYLRAARGWAVGKAGGRADAAGARLGLLVVAALVALPFLPLFLWAFAGEWRFPDLLPSEWSARGLEHLLDPGGRVLGATLESLVIAGATAVAAVAVGLPAGVALGAHEFRLKGLVIFFILLPILVPPLASTMGVHLTFIRLGLADTTLGVFLVHLVPTVPYAAIILTGIFAERTGELEEAARTLGATPWQAFLRVTLPEVAPGVAVAGLFSFLISWGQYILTLLIGGGNVVTLPMLLFSAASGNDPVITSALALVFAAPAVLALVVALRFLRPGDTDKGRGLLGLGKVS